MTPDKARDLVASFEGRRLTADYETYGLADGYRHIEHYVLLEIDEENPETGEPDVWTDTLGMPDKATADMIAAAPTLAAMIAGMHTEYGVEVHRPSGKWLAPHSWHDSPEQARNCLTAIHGRDTANWRIVRRYVTTPEEA